VWSADILNTTIKMMPIAILVDAMPGITGVVLAARSDWKIRVHSRYLLKFTKDFPEVSARSSGEPGTSNRLSRTRISNILQRSGHHEHPFLPEL
jgi:hypothetical protein